MEITVIFFIAMTWKSERKKKAKSLNRNSWYFTLVHQSVKHSHIYVYTRKALSMHIYTYTHANEKFIFLVWRIIWVFIIMYSIFTAIHCFYGLMCHSTRSLIIEDSLCINTYAVMMMMNVYLSNYFVKE